MKKLLIITSLFSLYLLAETVDFNHCVEKAEDFNSVKNQPTIMDEACYHYLDQVSDIKHLEVSSDQLVKITGIENILYTKIYDFDEDNKLVLSTRGISAGEQTGFHKIQSLKFNQEDSRVYILNKNQEGEKEISSLYYNQHGNLFPLTHLKSNELIGASNLAINQDEIFAISNEYLWIKVFNRLAHPLGNRDENSSSLLRKIKGELTLMQNPIDLVIDDSKIYLLDNDRVLIFSRSAKDDISPLKVIKGELTQIKNAMKIKLTDNGRIKIFNENGKVLFFDKESFGNVSPVKVYGP